ncbi:regucalcin like protein [Kalaharituber pfeilii]|nr:regucalcin like protein [Kalaharituber pfeilii]
MTLIQTLTTIEEPFVPVKNHLGEGPHYEASTGVLRWVDIISKEIHTVNVKEGPPSHKVLKLVDSVGFTADIVGREDEYIVGAKAGFAIVNKKTGSFRYIKKFWNDLEKEARANDGAVDSKGRLWMGTMNDFHVGEPQPEGILFRLDPDLTLHEMVRGVSIPNGIGWSLDDRLMYFIDSPSRSVFVYDFDSETGAISNKRVFWKLTDETGPFPDGLTVDSEGYLWIAIYEGSRVIRVSPTGEEVGQISLKAWKITCPVFGGHDLDELFITTAGVEEGDPHMPAGARDHGSVFRVKMDVKGLPANKFVLTTE